MIQQKWGIKRLCKKCAKKFYDLNQDPMTCPYCSTISNVQEYTSRYSKPSDKTDHRRSTKVSPIVPSKEFDDENQDIEDVDIVEDETDFDENVKLIEHPVHVNESE